MIVCDTFSPLPATVSRPALFPLATTLLHSMWSIMKRWVTFLLIHAVVYMLVVGVAIMCSDFVTADKGSLKYAGHSYIEELGPRELETYANAVRQQR